MTTDIAKFLAAAGLAAGILTSPRVASAQQLSTPDTVDPGERMQVAVSAEPQGSVVELWGPVTSAASKGAMLSSAPVEGGNATLAAPEAPGTYELRLVTSAGRMLTRATVDVAAVPVVLSVPALIGAGFETEIRWQGPGNPGDAIQIFDPLSGKVAVFALAEGSPGAMHSVTLPAPDLPGAYLIRYVTVHGVVLHSLPVLIDTSRSWLRSPVDLIAGDRFSVEWRGPHGAGHRFQLVDAEGTVLMEAADTATEGVGTAGLVAPKKAGDYRVRYIDGATGTVFADLPVEVHRK